LEARVESARRASEIHKRRTGRSLRVTEQDVINEEMYEEEDDDLPSKYRRLTAHLQTNSAAFNQRLAAYLTGQVGLRTTIDQYPSNPYGQQFPSNQQFSQTMYQNLAMAQQFQNQMMQSSSPYRQAPYQIPNMQQRANMHARSASIANPEMTSMRTQSPMMYENKQRSMSFTSAPVTTASPEQIQTPRSNPSSTPKTAYPPTPQAFTQQPLQFQPPYNNTFTPDASLLTMALPAESQMLLGSALDPRDPMTNMFMAGSQYMPNAFYTFDATLPPTINVNKPAMAAQLYPSFDDLNSTSSLDFQYAGQTSFFDTGMKETSGTYLGMPGGENFNLFIHQDQWNETASSSQS
jgi:hypothetical protein